MPRQIKDVPIITGAQVKHLRTFKKHHVTKCYHTNSSGPSPDPALWCRAAFLPLLMVCGATYAASHGHLGPP
ncbi:unnamed protein product [Fusarium graminearum]|uniref:Chromosome 3, complete genome n=2 Tax=Gibberella zeae TaxID=5518 RepID=A0A098E4M4_GIBZE|nr:unnamed protein product [Fusarium graminearum]CAF3525535.1 unnamed protein product [Fusarium graminearum]CAF3623331.1 unnamed protein product [Fusarium graminearum]CAG1961527.1 unnamed protein product [Fusarium graminearum]CAG1962088.1 unnamed protein product [Fusarium graminearum]